MSAFVTVGSTSFDNLIRSVSSFDILNLLASKGFEKIIFQIGRGSVIPESSTIIEIEWFRFKDDVTDYIKNASLVIGHGGAGTILESLINRKPLISVLNEALMDNHQGELANQLAKEGYLKCCTCATLYNTLQDYFADKYFVPYISEPHMFSAFLEQVMGFV
ncbi:UDP-N-acetylglucosamine transferase subunit ALG13 homolog [Stegodyphus dumicola]|uniref:UDP-N-acetylglucosamine transferase subunit ALG13 homolog n=1 Tax=Stegodyphus dumicola TaxID=202533 RepID=UPI0015B2BF29|nr:UDP-N-acetylglucosamine transferase subunit ALG13 homolog [Stegodyphus dumicola]XP_035220769.1 UDP-N-acetylglucosamine transferase subunit ALG13 homolog [Stegodyphus dumicola]XP_035220774.1 UDP-N-acetylglucosamine transferase subunit ALG13 homolog [Stegodyphus dumicola]XP_035220779.1 UDP-N-acetylglucosamine transferase subunit ALG13 homolog [Stegodyphus dumicola]XP_035220788.1 UDP-N-acetylglucosamine transferase subunit ALG13 homolog [Stegodyphus dumicola]XP_035220794.1 UDP-N-acetylglucosam